VKRYVDEPGTATVRAVLADHAIAASRLSEVEVASALARRSREGTLTRPELERISTALRADMSSLPLVELSAEIVQAAIVLLTRHPLRAGDSIQLASCLYLRREAREDVRLLAYDERLNNAARLEGVTLGVPESPTNP
jgi:predicted nucleic acid-binding protein